MQFGDWLGVEKARNTWYLFCKTESENFYEELQEKLGRTIRVIRIEESVYCVDSTGNRGGFERAVKHLTNDGDTAVLIYPTYKGLKHKVIR